MTIYLVAVVFWEMAYRGMQITPLPPQPMPTIEACQAVGAAMRDLMKFSKETYHRLEFKCVTVP
jgi:hypothetical protein